MFNKLNVKQTEKEEIYDNGILTIKEFLFNSKGDKVYINEKRIILDLEISKIDKKLKELQDYKKYLIEIKNKFEVRK